MSAVGFLVLPGQRGSSADALPSEYRVPRAQGVSSPPQIMSAPSLTHTATKLSGFPRELAIACTAHGQQSKNAVWRGRTGCSCERESVFG